MASDKLVSVIIPAFKAADYLKRSVGSVLAQTYADHEVIVVDDASPEPLDAAVAAIGSDRLRLFRQTRNGGTAAALNRGIAEARGAFIARLDADDWWAADKLAEQMRLFQVDPAIDVVFSDFVQVYMSGEPARWRGGLVEQLRDRGAEPIPVGDMGYIFGQSLVPILIRYTSFMHPSTVVVRRETLERIGPFNEQLYGPEDMEMWIRLADQCKIGMVPKVLMSAEVRPESVSKNYRRMSEQALKMYASLPTLLPSLSPESLTDVRRYCAREHTALGWHCRTEGNRAAARHHYLASLHYEFRPMNLLRWLRAWLPC